MPQEQQRKPVPQKPGNGKDEEEFSFDPEKQKKREDLAKKSEKFIKRDQENAKKQERPRQ